MIENRRIIHRDLRAKVSVTEVGPVTDFAIPNANDVGQAVAGHVGEKDSLRRFRKHNVRSDLFVRLFRNSASGFKTVSSGGWEPGEDRVLGYQNVSSAVA